MYKLSATKPPAATLLDPKPTAPIETPTQWPTYENIIETFRNVTQEARSGDFVYIHYSSHGARVKTIFGDIKDEGEVFDEALVPFNINTPDGHYLRDVEVATLLQMMMDKGLIVTVVLDSCHSGSATRSDWESGVRTRSIPEVDNRILDSDKSASSKMAVPIPDHIRSSSQRGAAQSDNWLLEPRDYTLLAACRVSEFAYESRFDGKNHGVFTYWLLDTLKLGWTDFTYQMLHNRVRAKVYKGVSGICSQTPMLGGECDRLFFGLQHVPSFYSATVVEVPHLLKVGSLVKLDVGDAHGINVGAEFAVYAASTLNVPHPQERLACVRVKDTEDVRSVAEVTILAEGSQNIHVGCRAALVSTGTYKKQQVVKLQTRPELPANIDQSTALNQVRTRFESQSNCFIRLLNDNEWPFDFQIIVNENSEYECWDKTNSSIPNLQPAIQISENDAADKLVRRLTHIAKYYSVRNLANPDRTSVLADKLHIEVIGNVTDENDQPKPRLRGESNALAKATSVPEVQDGEIILLRIRNLSSVVMNITVFDLESSWEIA